MPAANHAGQKSGQSSRRRRSLDRCNPRADVDAPAAQAPAEQAKITDGKAPNTAAEPVRSNFAETAFWQPALITDGKGEASFEFTVPDSVTSWNVWVRDHQKDLRSGSVQRRRRAA